ncbi:hypothetical protein BASA81_007062 [Batrachochytrium salamandrivorans]|nr:hypothetical protein BASA81_007062 [Batrachochytrium salamandrivorans]
MLSTRPPPTLGASLEKSKRLRSGSISMSLQHVTELLEDGVLDNREQKGVVKDLIISGNEEIIGLIQQYNQNGDKKPIQRLVRSYSFTRKSSLDLLGDDLTLEFAELLFPKSSHQHLHSDVVVAAPEVPPVAAAIDEEQPPVVEANKHSTPLIPNTPPGYVGEEEEGFDVMLLDEHGEDLHAILRTPPFRPVAFVGKGAPSSSSQRMRSCSLSSTSYFHSRGDDAMLSSMLLEDNSELDHEEDDEPDNEGEGHQQEHHRTNAVSFFGSAADDLHLPEHHDDDEEEEELDGNGGDDDDDDDDDEDYHLTAPLPTPIKKNKPHTKPMPIPKPPLAIASAANKPMTTILSKRRHQPPSHHHHHHSPPVSSSPSPPDSSLSHIPQLPSEEDIAYKKSLGICMTGAYSPDSRSVRVNRFVDKRDQRVWKKKVKYDVRKNFADSRLRVKGRFVKKEDEEMLREFMVFV